MDEDAGTFSLRADEALWRWDKETENGRKPDRGQTTSALACHCPAE